MRGPAVCLGLLAGLLAGPPLGAQPTMVLAGVVRDSASRGALQNAELRLVGTPYRAITGDDGSFRFIVPSASQTTLVLRRLGYTPRTVVIEGGHDDLSLLLATSVVALAPVTVRATRAPYAGRLAGYYERLERRMQGIFLTRSDIERERPPQLTDLLQRTPGVRVTRGKPGAQSIRVRGRTCAPIVWLDGSPMAAGDVDLDSFAPESLEGIELYLGSTNAPPRYQMARGQSECGTILLWSRGRDTEPREMGREVPPEELEALLLSLSVHAVEEVDRPAVVDSTAPWVVSYPAALRAAGVGGTAIAEFVVDTLGQVELRLFGIVSSSDRHFSTAIAEAAPRVRYRPAQRGGRAVRQLVRESFVFDPATGRD